MGYTVKQLANLAGVSTRTLHYYDEIGLLKPDSYSENGYRDYGEQAILQLQQILFFKELDFRLEEIRDIMQHPVFNLRLALEVHKVTLQQKASRLQRLIQTVDATIQHLEGDIEMSEEQLFEGFNEEKQKEYEQEIRQRYGKKAFEGVISWNSYTPEQKSKILAEGKTIYLDLARMVNKDVESDEVQAIIARWHQHMRYFYEPSIERMLSLAEMYNEDERFATNFRKIHPALPAFLRKAIGAYCRNLV